MQFIDKQPEAPQGWNDWFSRTDGYGDIVRSHNYAAHASEYHEIKQAKQFLIEEQHGLCAYCQKKLNIDTASIEHLVPKSFNKAISTNYHNLVAVCKTATKDSAGKLYCEPQRGNQLMVLPIMYKNCATILENGHPYFRAKADGTIEVKKELPQQTYAQLHAFIEILNIGSHSVLRNNRKNALDKLLEPFVILPTDQAKQQYLQIQFDRINEDIGIEYRQYLLMYLSGVMKKTK